MKTETRDVVCIALIVGCVLGIAGIWAGSYLYGKMFDPYSYQAGLDCEADLGNFDITGNYEQVFLHRFQNKTNALNQTYESDITYSWPGHLSVTHFNTGGVKLHCKGNMGGTFPIVLVEKYLRELESLPAQTTPYSHPIQTIEKTIFVYQNQSIPGSKELDPFCVSKGYDYGSIDVMSCSNQVKCASSSGPDSDHSIRIKCYPYSDFLDYQAALLKEGNSG